MESPPALADIVRTMQESGTEKVLLYYLKRIAALNPLLGAVTEVATLQQLRAAQIGQSAQTLPESTSGMRLAADEKHPSGVVRTEQLAARTRSQRSQNSHELGQPLGSQLDIDANENDELQHLPHEHLSGSNRASSIAKAPITKAPQLKSARPLEGVPFLVKDVIDVAGFRTLAGCELLLPAPPADLSADIVQRLQALGGIPVGKSAVPEACSQGRVDVQTYSRLHGVTRNPYSFSLTPGGSSGGSAVAVAVGMVPLAVGTDWAGSLRIPAAFCGICTLRASRGRLTIQHPERTVPPMPLLSDPPRDGQIMTAGIFTRTIRDLQYAMRPLLAPSRELPLLPVRSAVFAVTPSFPAVATDVRIQEALQRLPHRLKPQHGGRSCSARVVTGPSLRIKDIWKAYGIFSSSLTAHGDPHDPNAFKPSPPSVEDVRWARSVQTDTASAVDAFLDEQQCTAWIVPVCGTLPFPHNPEHKRFQLAGRTKTASYWPTMLGYVLPFSVSCNPVVAMPLELVEGAPCGVQVVGRSGADEELLSACALLESCLGAFPRPEEVNPQLRRPASRL